MEDFVLLLIDDERIYKSKLYSAGDIVEEKLKEKGIKYAVEGIGMGLIEIKITIDKKDAIKLENELEKVISKQIGIAIEPYDKFYKEI